VLVSSFAQDDGTAAGGPTVAPANRISFKWTLCTIGTEDGQYLFTESSTIENALLDQNTLFLSAADHGKTKDVYGVGHICFLLVNSHTNDTG